MRALALSLLLLLAVPATAETLSLGMTERTRGTITTHTYNAAFAAEWGKVALGSKYTATDQLAGGNLALTLTAPGLSLSYACGASLADAWSLRFGGQVGPGTLKLSWGGQEAFGAAALQRDLDLTWEASW